MRLVCHSNMPARLFLRHARENGHPLILSRANESKLEPCSH